MKSGSSHLSSLIILTLVTGACVSGCSSMTASQDERQTPIEDPFGTFYGHSKSANAPILVRSRFGDKSVEVELPESDRGGYSSFTVPMNTHMGDQDGRAPASTHDRTGGLGKDYSETKPTPTDHEILSTLPKAKPQDEWKRNEIEGSLGLVEQEDGLPQQETSYLAGLDKIKNLYKDSRYEAALIELDQMVRIYPTSPKLFEMRGTVLDRLGYTDLALNSWKQALEFNPKNTSLKKFLDKKTQMQTRRLASP